MTSLFLFLQLIKIFTFKIILKFPEISLASQSHFASTPATGKERISSP